MTIVVPIGDAKDLLTELARLAAKGETVVITYAGRPIFDLVPHREKGRLSLEAGEEFLRQRGVKEIFPFVAGDFDVPLPEDVLLRPLP